MPRNPRARTIACLSLVALAPWLIGATELRFQDGILSAHNHERFVMKVAPLRWNGLPVLRRTWSSLMQNCRMAKGQASFNPCAPHSANRTCRLFF